MFLPRAALLLAPVAAWAQSGVPPVPADIEQAVLAIARHAPVVRALEAINASSVRMFEEQVRINEIPAPPFKEQVRAEYYARKLKEAGLADTYIDKEGNVIGVRTVSYTHLRAHET